MLFNRADVPVLAEKVKWRYTPEGEYPEAIRRVWAARTVEEARQEETRNTVHLFWAMWLISAKYCVRDAAQRETPFAVMLGNLLADTRRNTLGGEWVAPEPPAPAPTLAEKVAALRGLADAMAALGKAPPDAVPRFLALRAQWRLHPPAAWLLAAALRYRAPGAEPDAKRPTVAELQAAFN